MSPSGDKKRILFVDDEPNILQGLQRLLRRHRHEWDMHFAGSAEEALALLARAPFQVIVSDLRMPGMNGSELLLKVQELYPDTARFVLSGHADKDMILQSVSAAHQFIAKPCDENQLQDAIQRALSLRDIFNSSALSSIIKDGMVLPTLPALYNRLTQALQSTQSSSDTIAEIIAQDVAMSAKILQLVNSAFFGIPHHISSISQAVSLLGAETINSIVLTAGVFSTFDDQTVQQFDIPGLYTHSLRVAAAAGRLTLALTGDRKAADEAMLAGMMHDVGIIVLINSGNEQWTQLYQTSTETSPPLYQQEQEQLGISHAEIGAYLLGLWGLSSRVTEAVAFHHAPSAAPTHELGPLTALHIANVTEMRLSTTDNIPALYDREYLDQLGISDQLDKYISLCNFNSFTTPPSNP